MKLLNLTLIAAVATIFIRQRGELSEERHSMEMTRTALAEASSELALAKQRSSNNTADLEARRASLEQIEVIKRLAMTNDAFAPADDGSWSTNRNYFYLPKKDLELITFSQFSGDGEVTDEATFLFGLTPDEKTAVERAYGGLMNAIRVLEQQLASKVESPMDIEPKAAAKLALYIPGAKAEVFGLKLRFREGVESILGRDRAEPFLMRAEEFIDEDAVFNPAPTHARTVMLAELGEPFHGYTHKLWIRDSRGQDPRGGREMMQGQPIGMFDPPWHGGSLVRFPVDAESPLWPYRHLFGTNAPLR